MFPTSVKYPDERARALGEWVERFWEKVDSSGGPGACWPWMGHRGSFGYGRFNVPVEGSPREQAPMDAHRLALILDGRLEGAGQERDGVPLVAIHGCDNPWCCNPRCLRVGTHLDNMRDKVERGRQPRGEVVVWSVLTEEKVNELREQFGPARARRTRAPRGAVKAEAERLGVARATIYSILNGRAWKHLLEAPSGR